jgi:hypothetical protein
MREQKAGTKIVGVCGLGEKQFGVIFAHAEWAVRFVRQSGWAGLVRVEKLTPLQISEV